MKFILGYIKGSVCPYDRTRPEVFVILKCQFAGVEYRIERFERDRDTGMALPRLKVYDSDDFPPEVIQSWLDNNQIIECLVSPDGQYIGHTK